MRGLIRFSRLNLLICIIIFLFPLKGGTTEILQNRAAWMQEVRWGVMNHYLADWIARVEKIEMNVEKWNKLIDNFDVEGLAKQLESVEAGYYLITLGQNSGYYLSPNPTYDRYVGISPSKCSRRDLVADLYEALHKQGIKLMVYLPSGEPNVDSVARERLQWQRGGYRNREFQLKWEQVIREWSLRWGEKVVGWWFDGCYRPNLMYRCPDALNFASFAAAARAGNPNGVVAFNPGVYNRLRSLTPYEDYLYVMASSSRGKFPPKFNGMSWTTGGDTRKWGAQYWGANQSCLYNALFATNRLELIDPMFEMYSNMYGSCALAARQQWGSKGIYIPETAAFDGLEKLSESIAQEMRALYLSEKPWEERSEEFCDYAFTKQPHSSRWNWKASGKWEHGRWHYTDKGAGPYAQVNHIFSRGAKIAYKYWLRYEYTKDEQWLRNRGYPIIKGVAEFYRNYPNVKKGPDGKYHIHNVNSNEPVRGGQDTDEEISAMRGILPVVIRASEILNVDAAMRPIWQDFLGNLAQLPRRQNGRTIWIKANDPVTRGRGSSLPDRNTMPMWYFDLCTLENEDPEVTAIANATFESFFRNGIGTDVRIGVLSKLGAAAAFLGRPNDVKFLIPNQIHTEETPVLINRMTLREGAQTTGLQRIGRAADALHLALCQSIPAGPGETPVIRVFPAWPSQWDVTYRLLARGAFLVSSSMKNGRIEFIEVQPQTGGECKLRNPWGDRAKVTLYRNSAIWKEMRGTLLKFDTNKGQNIVIVPESESSNWLKRTIPNVDE